MRILVTGSNGLLGQKLTGLLSVQPSVYLIATARSPSNAQISNGEFRHLDITDSHEVMNVVESTHPDVIIHCAAMTQVDRCELDKEACWKANVTAVQHVIAAARKCNCHLIHISTDFVFDGTHEMLDESAIPGPVNYYGESKLEGERLVQTSGIPWCIIRTVLVYGITSDMSRSNIVLWVKNSLETGKTIQVVDDQWRTPTLAEDLARGCLSAALQKATGIYHISGKDYMSVYDIAIRAAKYFNLDTSMIRPVSSEAFPQSGRRPLKTGFVIDKAQKELKYEPHSFEEGIAIMERQFS